MTRFHHATALAAVLVACTPLDAREPSKPIAQQDAGTAGKPQPDPVPDPTPTAQANVAIAVASVQLEDNCGDPPSAPPPASEAPAAPARPQKRNPAAGASAFPGSNARIACQQSTMQLRFTNEGDAAVSIAIAAVELHDVQSASLLAPVPSRLPAAFTTDGSYQPWDGRLAAGAQFHASYRLTPPSWSMVDAKLGNSRGRELVLEITVEVDGEPTTVRSPAFVRPPELVMPPT